MSCTSVVRQTAAPSIPSSFRRRRWTFTASLTLVRPPRRRSARRLQLLSARSPTMSSSTQTGVSCCLRRSPAGSSPTRCGPGDAEHATPRQPGRHYARTSLRHPAQPAAVSKRRCGSRMAHTGRICPAIRGCCWLPSASYGRMAEPRRSHLRTHWRRQRRQKRLLRPVRGGWQPQCQGQHLGDIRNQWVTH